MGGASRTTPSCCAGSSPARVETRARRAERREELVRRIENGDCPYQRICTTGRFADGRAAAALPSVRQPVVSETMSVFPNVGAQSTSGNGAGSARWPAASDAARYCCTAGHTDAAPASVQTPNPYAWLAAV